MMEPADDLEVGIRELLLEVGAHAGEPPTLDRSRLRKARLTQLSYAGMLVVVLAGLAIGSAWGFRTLSTPTPIEPIRPGPTSQSLSPSPSPTGMLTYDVTIHGWRFASTEILRREGLDRALKLDCTPRRVPASTRTELDFELTYVPPGMEISGGPEMKWVCGSITLSVHHEYSLSPRGSLRI